MHCSQEKSNISAQKKKKKKKKEETQNVCLGSAILRKGGEFLTHVWLSIKHFHLTRSFLKSLTRPQEE